MRTFNGELMEHLENLPAIITKSAFSYCLKVEAERSKRYGHPFAVLVLRPPTGSAFRDTPGLNRMRENLPALTTSGLVRDCDIVSVLEEEQAIAVLLPETGIAGAGVIVKRLMEAISDPRHQLRIELYVYPENSDKITEIAKKAA